ncbi:MAG TPA: amidase family protein, partial [Magnetospirillum sp.]|nr:amidase family protein [Magnetospirillum sp.]
MHFDYYDGLGLAQLVREGQASAAELAEIAIGRIERVNATLNAVITPMYDSARQRATEKLEGPFAGVPYLVKDLMVFIPGTRMTNGSRALMNFAPGQECGQAQAIREAGFVVVGKTNTSELGASPLTAPQAFGPTCNPWRTSLNSGGSSGGSTAAVAARVVPMASSSDGGGSIRLPASFCGVFGFKPSRGVNPHDTPKAWGGAVASHATTISVRDSAAYLDWTSKRLASPNPQVPVAGSYLAHTVAPPRPLRIGLCVQSPAGGAVHPDCVEAVTQAGRLLEQLGHEVTPCPLPFDGRAQIRAHLTAMMAYTARDVIDMRRWVRRPAAKLELYTRMLAELGAGVRRRRLNAALADWEITAQAMARFHQTVDVLMTPVTAVPWFAHDAFDLSRVESMAAEALTRLRLGRRLFSRRLLDAMIDKGGHMLPFTGLANCTGQPAMSVPLYWNAEGLPVGVQFVADRGCDGLLFNLAAQLEAARPWRRRRPPICAA